MNTITLSFGKRIRDIRMSKNISQEKLAELSGLHPTYIGQLERGEKSPTLESIYKISVGLDILEENHITLSQTTNTKSITNKSR